MPPIEEPSLSGRSSRSRPASSSNPLAVVTRTGVWCCACTNQVDRSAAASSSVTAQNTSTSAPAPPYVDRCEYAEQSRGLDAVRRATEVLPRDRPQPPSGPGRRQPRGPRRPEDGPEAATGRRTAQAPPANPGTPPMFTQRAAPPFIFSITTLPPLHPHTHPPSSHPTPISPPQPPLITFSTSLTIHFPTPPTPPPPPSLYYPHHHFHPLYTLSLLLQPSTLLSHLQPLTASSFSLQPSASPCLQPHYLLFSLPSYGRSTSSWPPRLRDRSIDFRCNPSLSPSLEASCSTLCCSLSVCLCLHLPHHLYRLFYYLPAHPYRPLTYDRVTQILCFLLHYARAVLRLLLSHRQRTPSTLTPTNPVSISFSPDAPLSPFYY